MTRRFILRLWQAQTAFSGDMQDITVEAFRYAPSVEPLFCFQVGDSRSVRAMVRDEPPWQGNGYRARRCAMVDAEDSARGEAREETK